jgi:hypothetical protein
MTEKQTEIAIKMLQYLVDNNNYERDGNVYSYICNWDTSDRSMEGDYEHVRDSLIKDYRLIRREGAELHLTPDGEAAQRIGFEKYLRKIKKGTQLEITLKRMDVLAKFLTILKESKTILVVTAGIVWALFGLFSQYAVPLLTKAANWLCEVVHTLTATQ